MKLAARTHDAELPENAPRYVVLSHELVSREGESRPLYGDLTYQKHKDGRVSYPLLLINWCGYLRVSTC